MTDDARWNALTDEQRAFLAKLGRAPWRWLVSDRRYAATYARMERENAGAKAEAEVARQRAYYETLWRVTGYDGADYRIRMAGQRSWVRATKQQYDQAATTGTQRSIGVPEPELLQITAA